MIKNGKNKATINKTKNAIKPTIKMINKTRIKDKTNDKKETILPFKIFFNFSLSNFLNPLLKQIYFQLQILFSTL